MADEQFKRHVAYKLRIGDVLKGKTVFDGDRFRFLEIGENHVARVNLIANIIDKFVQDGEKKFASITLDDASGQIKVKVFGEDIKQFEQLEQGDTIMTIALVRQWNNELYLTPDIIKKKDPKWLLVRKLEIDLTKPKELPKEERASLKDKVLEMVKKAEGDGGIETESMILELNSSPDAINTEIKRLLEEGIIYEPRPGKVRYLG